jgi:hypothetical protein
MTTSRISNLEIEALNSVAFLDWGVGEWMGLVVEKEKGYCIQVGRPTRNRGHHCAGVLEIRFGWLSTGFMPTVRSEGWKRHRNTHCIARV